MQSVVSVTQTLELIKQLIAENKGDVLRLRYIYEFLEKGRHLYASDQTYLEKKIDAKIIYEEKKPPSKQEEISKKIRNLLELGIGDSERLKFMLTWISKNQTLLNSDQIYLNQKVQIIHQKFTNKKSTKKTNPIYVSIKHN